MRNMSVAIGQAGSSRVAYPGAPIFDEAAQKNAQPVMPLPARPVIVETTAALPKSSVSWFNKKYLAAFAVIALMGGTATYQASASNSNEPDKLNAVASLPEPDKLANKFPASLNLSRNSQALVKSSVVAPVTTRRSQSSSKSSADSSAEVAMTQQDETPAPPVRVVDTRAAQLDMIQEQVGELKRRRAPKLKKIKDQVKQVREIFADLEP